MLDVSHKTSTLRSATAEAVVKMQPETLEMVKNATLPKGDAITVAKVAAIQAAKNTQQIIPYCHSLPLDYAGMSVEFGVDILTIHTEVRTVWKTGVEMEAMAAASVAALTIYDMTKMVDDHVTIEKVHLLKKKGGKSDFKEAFARELRAAVLVLSDSVSKGVKEDTSGLAIMDRLQREEIQVVDYKIIPDERELIAEVLRYYADVLKVDLILTTGGTGFSPRDCTPEAMMEILDKEIPGIPEMMRAYGQERTPYAMLSRAKAGQRGNTLIVNLPGSRRGVEESLDALFPSLLHAFKMVWGGKHPWGGNHPDDNRSAASETILSVSIEV